jgi:hypothetical protein
MKVSHSTSQLIEGHAALKISKKFTLPGMRFLVKRLIHKYIPDLTSTISYNTKNKKDSRYTSYCGFLDCYEA